MDELEGGDALERAVRYAVKGGVHMGHVPKPILPVEECCVDGLPNEGLVAAQVEWHVQPLCDLQDPRHILHHLGYLLNQQCSNRLR